MEKDEKMRVERPFVITPPGITVTTEDGITIRMTGSPGPITDSMLADMFRDAMKSIRRYRKENPLR